MSFCRETGESVPELLVLQQQAPYTEPLVMPTTTTPAEPVNQTRPSVSQTAVPPEIITGDGNMNSEITPTYYPYQKQCCCTCCLETASTQQLCSRCSSDNIGDALHCANASNTGTPSDEKQTSYSSTVPDSTPNGFYSSDSPTTQSPQDYSSHMYQSTSMYQSATGGQSENTAIDYHLLPEYQRIQIGYELRDLIIDCQFAGYDCDWR